MLRWGKIEISGGFLLIAAALYYLDTQNLLIWAVAACLFHELGHYLAIYLLGGRVNRLRLSCVGAEMCLSARQPLTRWGEFCAALAGPGANLLLAVLSARLAGRIGEALYFFAGINLSVAAFNLLPISLLDGGRALKYLLSAIWSDFAAEQALRAVSQIVSLSAVIVGGVLVWQGRANVTLLITAGWLLALSLSARKKRGRRYGIERFHTLEHKKRDYCCKG